MTTAAASPHCNGFLISALPTLRVSSEVEMAAFDALPAPLRAVIADLPAKISAVPVLAAWENPPPVLESLDCIERLQALALALKTTVEAAR
ncbi:hypothetical protein [Caulobacter segnis]|uniref:Uncharacterized protein n=1 Tax=Caulobacter segnis TaxID=88688 RepID=A0A2W5X845_9CAUL|nr:hypothetical protein [Caulobacter segnis]PZR37214.1 MAG: hypothetical protein DI526_01470 [Caulobacter segnis]